MNRRLLKLLLLSLLLVTASFLVVSGVAAQPGYEPAYVNGKTVTINAIDVPNHAPSQAQADFYEVVYPIGWQSIPGLNPQCQPCDHDGNGIDFIDYHDHILDSMPSDPGHGQFSPLWHVFLVLPNYSFLSGPPNPIHDALINAAYAPFLPTKSEAAVDDLLAATLPDGSPVAVEIDTHFYFLCAVVNPHAAK